MRKLSYQPLTNLNIFNSIDLTQDSCYFRNQDSISVHPFEVDQHQIFENHIDVLVSYPFSEIELENECDLEPQLGNSFLLLDSITTLVSSPDCKPFPESILDPVSVHREIESPIFYDQQVELDQYHTFESFIDKLASSHFYEIELNQ